MAAAEPAALTLLGPAPGAPSCPHGEPGPVAPPELPVLGSRRAPDAGCSAAGFAKALLSETELQVLPVLSYPRVCP